MGEFIENKNMCSSQSVTFNLWIIIDGLGVFFFFTHCTFSVSNVATSSIG